MNTNDNKAIKIFNELKKEGLIPTKRKIKSSKKVRNFKASVFTSNTISFNPDLSELDENVLKLLLLHEEGHLIRKQYGLNSLLFLIGIGFIPLLYCLIFRIFGSDLIMSTFFLLFVFVSSFRILSVPLELDEYNSDEFASKILRDRYNIKKPSEILKFTLERIPSLNDTFWNRLFIAFFDCHPSTYERVKKITDTIDEKM
jgi:Zn-dependent protease with chaperone function